jgi:hypothetical protein|tara:strand:+ start:762 stop:1013 length:252 start_codon:yes stop_codon:yes gene_type:complete
MIHQLIFHGKGGYDYNTIYNMPIWLRKFTYSEITNFYSEEKKQLDNASSNEKGKKNMINSDGKINTQDFASASKQYKGKTSYK